MLQLLAQSSSSVGSLFFWSAIVLGLAGVLILAIGWMRRRTFTREQGTMIGFTLSDLREMRRKGAISDAEFEVAKNQVIKGLKGKEEPPKPQK